MFVCFLKYIYSKKKKQSINVLIKIIFFFNLMETEVSKSNWWFTNFHSHLRCVNDGFKYLFIFE